MILTIEDLLSQEEVKSIRNYLKSAKFVDGKITAGYAASQVKYNQQLSDTEDLSEKVSRIMKNNILFNSFAIPDEIHSLIFSKTEIGGKYGTHIDNAFINDKRTDVSFTIFISDPEEYEGGCLSIENFGEYKLKSGDAVLYPSTTLHQVQEVISGTRFVCCGWVKSKVKNPIQREILYDLEAVKISLFSKYGKIDEFDLICKTHSNLIREWN